MKKSIKSKIFFPLEQIAQIKESKTINNNKLLFDTIAEEFGYSFIVDSTKDIVRMNLLKTSLPNKVHVIILIRDLYGVVFSYLKLMESDNKSNTKINIIINNWLNYYNGLIKICKSLNISPIIVNYREYTQHPENVRQAIANYLNIKIDNSTINIDTKTYHLVAGNPMRYKGNLIIRYDNKWKQGLTKEQIQIIDNNIYRLDPFYKSQYLRK